MDNTVLTSLTDGAMVDTWLQLRNTEANEADRSTMAALRWAGAAPRNGEPL